MAAHGFQVLSFVVGVAIALRLLARLVETVVRARRMRRAVAEAVWEMDIVDLGPVDKNTWGVRPTHPMCEQVLRVGKDRKGATFRYCALCQGLVDNRDTGQSSPTVISLAAHPRFKPRVVSTAPQGPTSPTAA
jgi:hypothetical protein